MKKRDGYSLVLTVCSLVLLSPAMAEENGATALTPTGASTSATEQKTVYPDIDPIIHRSSTGEILPAKAPVNVPLPEDDRKVAAPEKSPVVPRPDSGTDTTGQVVTTPPAEATAVGTAVSAATTADEAPAAKKPSVLFNPFKKNHEQAAVGTPQEPAVAEVKPDKPRRFTASRSVGDRALWRAKDYYAAGKLGEAEKAADVVLNADPAHEGALTLKRKIARVRERIAVARANLANEYLYNAGVFYKKRQVLDALIEVKLALELDPGSREAKALYLDICQFNQNIIDRSNPGDRSALRKALAYYIDGKYSRAAAAFRKIQGKVEEVDNYLPAAETHSYDAENRKRSDVYFVAAIEDMRRERYQPAQDNLYLALEQDRNNMDARLMLEQVDLELMGK